MNRKQNKRERGTTKSVWNKKKFTKEKKPKQTNLPKIVQNKN